MELRVATPEVVGALGMGLIPTKEDRGPIVSAHVTIRQFDVEQVDWIAQRTGYSRNRIFELAVQHFIKSYEKENGLAEAGRIPLGSKKKRHRTSPKDR